jgi:hypothetical protein
MLERKYLIILLILILVVIFFNQKKNDAFGNYFNDNRKCINGFEGFQNTSSKKYNFVYVDADNGKSYYLNFDSVYQQIRFIEDDNGGSDSTFLFGIDENTNHLTYNGKILFINNTNNIKFDSSDPAYSQIIIKGNKIQVGATDDYFFIDTIKSSGTENSIKILGRNTESKASIINHVLKVNYVGFDDGSGKPIKYLVYDPVKLKLKLSDIKTDANVNTKTKNTNFNFNDLYYNNEILSINWKETVKTNNMDKDDTYRKMFLNKDGSIEVNNPFPNSNKKGYLDYKPKANVFNLEQSRPSSKYKYILVNMVVNN